MKLKCTACEQTLRQAETGFVCPCGCSYPMTPGGFLKMTPAHGVPGRTGSSPDVVRARSAFLNKGFYAILSEAIEDTVTRLLRLCPSPAVIVDCCCGEGYFTRNLWRALRKQGKKASLFAFDLSEEAVRLAAEQSSGGIYAHADVYAMPVADASVDLALNCFGPVPDAEMTRVLRPGGLLLSVIPGRMHLYAMKTALFDLPSVLDETGHCSKTLERVKQMRVRDEISLAHTEDLENLFIMTPDMAREGDAYFARLKALQHLDIEIDFILQIFRKPKEP